MPKKRVEIIIKLSGDNILEKIASKFGTGAHIIVSKKYSGKKVKIIAVGEILERVISDFGTGAHVIIPREYVGKRIKIVIGGKYG